MSPPKVSILIPTLQGEADLRRLLPALDRQIVEGGFERIAIDSSSTDGTRGLLEGAGFGVTTISRATFGHGKTRNALAELASGDVLIFLSQDAVPCGDDFLQTLVNALDPPRVAGATARILPHEGDDPLTARTVLQAPEASEDPWSCSREPDDEGAAEIAQCSFNNVASCIRATVLREHPFPDVPFGEDVAWATRVLQAGWTLCYEPCAVARHAHRYGPLSAFKRYRTDAEFHLAFHGRRVRPSIWSVARGILFECREDLRFVRARRTGEKSARGSRPWLALLRSPFLRTGQILGQYAGGRRRSEAWARSAAGQEAESAGGGAEAQLPARPHS